MDLPTKIEREDIWRLHLNRRLSGTSKAGGGFELTPDALAELSGISEGFSGAEIEQAVIGACFDAFADRRSVTMEDLLRTVRNTVPLSVTQAEQITRIREWAESRAVAATSADARDAYEHSASADPSDISSWRGGRAIDF